MRIVAGRHRGLKLAAPAGRTTRPTSDRARETLFNLLSHGRFAGVLADACVLDAFAGSGALGLEALSRGARDCAFLETDAAALAALRANIAKAGRQADTRVLAGDATVPPAPGAAPRDLVFLDAPYGRDLTGPALGALSRTGWIGPDSLIAVQIDPAEPAGWTEGWAVLVDRRAGKARFLIVRPPPAPGPGRAGPGQAPAPAPA